MALGSNTVICELHVRFSRPTAENLRVYVAWYSDRTLELFTDGKPVRIRRDAENYVRAM